MYLGFFINQLDEIDALSEVIDARKPIEAIDKVEMLHT
jgi:hypothetical protein